MIQIRNLNKYYHKGKSNEIHVINNTTLTLEDTGLVCILGESGSGKTTLMNTISGLDDFSDGEIEVDGITIKKYGDKNQERVRNEKFGYIFQNYYLLQDRTVEYNLMQGLSLYDIPDEEKEERIDYVLRAVDMWKYKRRPVSQLSGGQQQRIAIARALSKSPQIIFADEPTGNLDEKNTMRIMGILKKISKKCLVVVVTHEKTIANFFADRILWIEDGKIDRDKDFKKGSAYEYVEDTNLYLGEYEKKEKQVGNVKLQVYSNEPIPDTGIQLIYENGKVYIHAKKEEDIIFLKNSDEKKMVNGKKPVVEQDDIESVEFTLAPLKGARRPKMSAREIRELAKANIKALGKKKIFLVITLFLMSVLMVLLVEDMLSVMRTDKQSIAVADSHLYQVAMEKKSMISDTEYERYVGQILDAMDGAGMEKQIIPINTLTYRYKGYEQLENMDYQIAHYSFVSLDKISEKDLICGRMPENNKEVVADRWVIENFIEKSEQVQNVMDNYRQALNSCFTTNDGVVLTIVGISDTEQPDIYIDRETMILISSSYIDVMTVSEAKEKFEDFEEKNLTIDEDGNVEVLTAEDEVRTRYRKDVMRKYSLLDELYEKTLYDSYYDKQLKEKEEEYGVTWEEYQNMINDISETAPYRSYTYLGTLVEGINYRSVGCIPTRYGVDYIIPDEAVDLIAKSIIINEKECYIYLPEEMESEKAEEMILAAVPNEIKESLDIVVTNKNQEILDEYEQEKSGKIGSRLLMMGTIFLITMMILYFMMKANAVTRMEDLGVFRMLGISKYSIMGMFAYETFLITCYTSLAGAVLTYAATYVISRIPSVELEFYYPWQLFAATVAVIYLFNICIGILPIRKMLKLPPAQLAAKYDF